jgi:ribosomal protein S6--L-glutamate ligase
MKIAILSRNRQLYSTRRLVEAGQGRGHEMVVLDPLRCQVDVASQRPGVHYRGEQLDGFDAVIPRIGASITFYGLAVLRQFEVMGVYPLNESVAIGRSRDKLRSLQLLARKGVGLPVTGFAHSVDANFLVQEFIKEAGGADIRCFVIGDRVVAAMKRQAKEGEFRSNLHRGGSAALVRLTPAERATAARAAKIVGLNVAGVDILRSNHGPLVMEVNSSPGLEGIETATGKDVADQIILFIEKNAKPNRTRTKGKG